MSVLFSFLCYSDDSSRIASYIYIYIQKSFCESGTNLLCEFVFIITFKFIQENLNSRLVPDSRNNFCNYFALLSIEHFLYL